MSYSIEYKSHDGLNITFSVMSGPGEVSTITQPRASRDADKIPYGGKLNTDPEKRSYMGQVLNRWLEVNNPSALFAGISVTEAIPQKAQDIATNLGLPIDEAKAYYYTTRLPSAATFFDWIRTTSDNSQLGI